MRTNPVMLVHGFAMSYERNWREGGWIDLLSDANRQVIGVDLLGHGSSDKPHDPEAYRDMHRDLIAHLPSDGTPVDVIAFSMGSELTLRLASEMPERFGRIVVSGVGANLFENQRSTRIVDAILGHGDTDDRIGQQFAQYGSAEGNDPEALAAVLQRPRQPMTSEQLARVTCPVLVVLGDRDFVGSADKLMAALPHATLVTLKGVDHFATPKDMKFLDAALEFLEATPW
jgi:pimeloyl-ACP methyl ester carboxylesterase